MNHHIVYSHSPPSSFPHQSTQNAIDLDQMAMEEQLGLETSDSYAKAKNIYQNGAHSKPIAEVTITGGAPAAIPEGAEVIGKTTSGQEVRGEALEAAASGASVLRIQYHTTPIQEAYVGCQVGALEKDGNTEGCKFATRYVVLGIPIGSSSHAPFLCPPAPKVLRVMEL